MPCQADTLDRLSAQSSFDFSLAVWRRVMLIDMHAKCGEPLVDHNHSPRVADESSYRVRRVCRAGLTTSTADPHTSTRVAVAAAEAGAALERLRQSLGLPAVPEQQLASDAAEATQLVIVVSAHLQHHAATHGSSRCRPAADSAALPSQPFPTVNFANEDRAIASQIHVVHRST